MLRGRRRRGRRGLDRQSRAAPRPALRADRGRTRRSRLRRAGPAQRSDPAPDGSGAGRSPAVRRSTTRAPRWLALATRPVRPAAGPGRRASPAASARPPPRTCWPPRSRTTLRTAVEPSQPQQRDRGAADAAQRARRHRGGRDRDGRPGCRSHRPPLRDRPTDDRHRDDGGAGAHRAVRRPRRGGRGPRASWSSRLPASGVAVLNADVPEVAGMAHRTEARVAHLRTCAPTADVVAESVRLDEHLAARFVLRSPWGPAEVHLAVPGEHQVGQRPGRGGRRSGGRRPGRRGGGRAWPRHGSRPGGWTCNGEPTALLVLNDAYNANPTSMAAALRSLAALQARAARGRARAPWPSWEPTARHAHLEIARLAASLELAVVAVAAPRYGPEAEHVPDREAALQALGDDRCRLGGPGEGQPGGRPGAGGPRAPGRRRLTRPQRAVTTSTDAGMAAAGARRWFGANRRGEGGAAGPPRTPPAPFLAGLSSPPGSGHGYARGPVATLPERFARRTRAGGRRLTAWVRPNPARLPAAPVGRTWDARPKIRNGRGDDRRPHPACCSSSPRGSRVVPTVAARRAAFGLRR